MRESDAEAVFKYLSDRNVAEAAGRKAHADLDETKDYIKDSISSRS